MCFHIQLPPLRDRKEDIAAISEAILANVNKKHGCRIAGVHASTLERFQSYSWPGNIRELRNVLERAAIMAGEGMLLPKHLAMDPTAAPEPQSGPQQTAVTDAAAGGPVEPGESLPVRPGASLEEIEEAYINRILQQTNNNKTKAADILGISVRTLHNRLGQLKGDKANGATG
jgi:DNA-binding NtrC family response regulator